MKAMRLWTIAIIVMMFCNSRAVSMPPNELETVNLATTALAPGVPLREAKYLATGVRIAAKTNAKGGGDGTLTLEFNKPTFDEFGTPLPVARVKSTVAALELKCSITFVKKGDVFIEAGLPPEEWSLYRVSGPKIVTSFFIATPESSLGSGRLLVGGKSGGIEYSIPIIQEHGLALPCHPGCFPSGTAVLLPTGTKPIEDVKSGDILTVIGKDGAAGEGRVADVFASQNELVEISTDDGHVLMTSTLQPLCLVDGGFQTSGKLKPGERIWRWESGGRRAVVVRDVQVTGREVQVFNVVIGDGTVFVAGGFLARCKPPATGTGSQ